MCVKRAQAADEEKCDFHPLKSTLMLSQKIVSQ